MPLIVSTFSAAALAGGSEVTERTAGAGQLAVQAERSRANGVFYNHVLAHLGVSAGWTGSVSGCRPGRVTSAAREAALDVVNGYRRLAGMRAVRFADTLNGRAQSAALMMLAARRLSHSPDRSWPCYTRAGHVGASRSDLALGLRGVRAIPAYADDNEAGNELVLHRRWLLDPRQARMGFGQAGGANALYVLDTSTWSWPSNAPTFVAWPAAGYFPLGLEPRGRWSLGSARSSIDFSRARVSMSGPAGSIPVRTYRDRGVIAWDLGQQLARWVGVDRRYTVTVSGIRSNGSVLRPVTYFVTLVPLRRLLPATAPEVRASTTSGRTVLSASKGNWSPARHVSRAAFQWLRDGVAIEGATGSSYTLTNADRGRRIAVRVQALPSTRHYRPGSTTVALS